VTGVQTVLFRSADKTYARARQYLIWQGLFESLNLSQLVTDITWSRTVNGHIQESILDHIYVNDTSIISETLIVSQEVSDHSPIITRTVGHSSLSAFKTTEIITRRSWARYTKEALETELNQIDWGMVAGPDAETTSQNLDKALFQVLERLVPLRSFKTRSRDDTPIEVRRLQKQYKNLLNKSKRRNSDRSVELKNISRLIKYERTNFKTKTIRDQLRKNPDNLWRCVAIENGKSNSRIPDLLKLAGKSIDCSNRANVFADFFSNKVDDILLRAHIDQDVYNGSRKILGEYAAQQVKIGEVLEIMDNLKPKHCSGPDEIPLIFLKHGACNLVGIITFLINQVLHENSVPSSWREAKIVPLHKKGRRDQVENYRPISNLNSITKIFETILKSRIEEIEKNENVDVTGCNQHGFKTGHSTITACLDLQHRIAEECDQGNYVAVASTDLTAAFDVVNFDLLIKRMEIMGLPKYLVDISSNWLRNRRAFVQIDGHKSQSFEIKAGTIQGSINGANYFKFFIAPLMEVKTDELVGYADDGYVFAAAETEDEAISLCGVKTTENLTWLRASGMIVNPAKTTACVFSRKNLAQTEIEVDGLKIKIEETMNVLGIVFDRKLNWSKQVQSATEKALRSKQGLGIIAKHLNSKELRILATALFYSRLYYGSAVWMQENMPKLHLQKLERASTSMLKIVLKNKWIQIPATTLHAQFTQATPSMMRDYSNALALFDIISTLIPDSVLPSLTHNYMESRRHDGILFTSSNKTVIGGNSISQRVSNISKKLKDNWQDMPKKDFKTYAKKTLIFNELARSRPI
jgi:hypothetical protein